MKVLFSCCLAIFILSYTQSYASYIEWVKIDGAIGPVADKVIGEGIKRAESNHAEAIVIELDTPGGLLKTTRIICKEILASSVPVVMYISPSGARAGSAGVFLTLACHIAVMAPGTNIGAAHPVGLGGGDEKDTSSVMEGKVINDAAAFARTLAEKNHKNIAWAERAVRESVSATESEASQLGVIDFIASSRDSLLILLEGRVVQTSIASDTLHTAGQEIKESPLSLRLRILDLIADPSIAYILLLLGVYGLFFELYNPGAIIPGVLGSVSLLMSFFSLQLLPFNWAGLLLIVLGIILFILEVKITSYGTLTIGGILAMLFGSMMLFDSSSAGISLPWQMIIPATMITALFFLFIVGMGLRAQNRKIITGIEGIIGETGVVFAKISPLGKVQVHGEIWNAISTVEIDTGSRIRVTAADGFTLKVEPLS